LVRTAAVPVLLAVALAASGCGGGSALHHQRELYMQKCAACHGVAPGAASPDLRADNLLGAAHRPDREQVRRAVIDGRPGMPAGLLGGHDVDLIADYLSQDRH
jgi:mono/diheme cytochrome c family protein